MRTTVIHHVVFLGALALLASCGSDTKDGAGGDAAGDTSQGDDTAITDTSNGGDAADVDDTGGATDTQIPGDTADTSDTGPDYTRPTLVEIRVPADGAAVKNQILVDLIPVGRDELKVDSVVLRVNGFAVFQDVKLPTRFVLDTRQFDPGELVLQATARAGFESGGHQVTVYPNNPPIKFLSATPEQRIVKDGQLVSVQIRIDGPSELDLTADWSTIDSNYDPQNAIAYAAGAGIWSLSYIISATNTKPDGTYTVPITAQAGPWVVNYGQLDLRLQNQPINPLRITGGIFVDEQLPQPSPSFGASAPTVTSENAFIVTGGSSSLRIDAGALDYPSEVVGYVIGLEGHAGYFQVPTTDASEPINVTALLRAYTEYEYVPQILPVRVATRDQRGRVSPYGAYLFTVTPVGSGDIQVSVSWDTPTDVDLHVIDPNGCEMYFARKTCGTGKLDLDSNPACSIDGINNENVFWPPGQAPVGTYTVKLDYWSDCGGQAANYAVTINACGRTQVFEGRFAPGTSDGGGAGSGVLITTFNNSVCQTSIKGRVRYQDRPLDETGFGALTWRPVRNAVVELRRLLTGEVISTASTNQFGEYALQFTNDGPPGLVVVVKAKTDVAEGLRDIEILDHPKFKKLYEVSSSPVVLEPGQDQRIVDIDIPVELKAGAFNIFDVLQEGYDLARRMTGRELGHLIGFWATGTDTTDTLFCSQFLYDGGVCTDFASVSVQGKESDRDEYDDQVILKELLKYATLRLSRDDHPGGKPNGTRENPNLAWSEGVSTFFANDIAGSRYFVNSRPFGVYLVDDVETQPSPFAYGTANSTMSGDLSYDLIATALWDLADGQDVEAFDNVQGQRSAVYDVLFNYLPSEAYVDRGFAGVDFVDFLDGWFCRGWGQRDAVEAILDHLDFPYDFAGPLGCDHL